MSEAVAAATSTFAPSELVLLFGDRFTPEAGLLASREEVLTSGIKVNAEKLMNAAVGPRSGPCTAPAPPRCRRARRKRCSG